MPRWSKSPLAGGRAGLRRLIHLCQARVLFFEAGNAEFTSQRIAHGGAVERVHRYRVLPSGVLRPEDLRAANLAQEPVERRSTEEKRLPVALRRCQHSQFVRPQKIL